MKQSEFQKKYSHLLAFIMTSVEQEVRTLHILMEIEAELNVSILKAVGQDEAEKIISQAKDVDFLPAFKLEVGYEEKSEEEKVNFKENVEDTVDFLKSVDLGEIFD